MSEKNKYFYVVDGEELSIGRCRTRLISGKNMLFRKPRLCDEQNRSRVSAGKGRFNEFNYCKRMKKRGEELQEMCYNTFNPTIYKSFALTFDQKRLGVENVKNIDYCENCFKHFLDRIRRKYDNFEYVAVYSRQKNGAWHYHMMCNLPRDTEEDTIAEIWKYGSCRYTHYCKGETYEFKEDVRYLKKNLFENNEEKKQRHAIKRSDGVKKNIVYKTWDKTNAEEAKNAIEKARSMEKECRRVIQTSKKLIGKYKSTRGKDHYKLFDEGTEAVIGKGDEPLYQEIRYCDMYFKDKEKFGDYVIAKKKTSDEEESSKSSKKSKSKKSSKSSKKPKSKKKRSNSIKKPKNEQENENK